MMLRARDRYDWNPYYEEPSYEYGDLEYDEDCELYALVFLNEGKDCQEEEFSMINAEFIDPSLLQDNTLVGNVSVMNHGDRET
jgi:hypothetical protein